MRPSAQIIGTFAEQGIPNTAIPNERLSGNSVKFNGSIIEWEGRRLLAYRRYDPVHGRMNLAISVLGNDWMPTGEHHVPAMPCKLGNERHEDVRLFVHKKRLWMACAEVYNPTGSKGWHCSQRVFRLDKDFNPDHTLDIKVGKNFIGTEKNWAFFSWNDRLFFIYDTTTGNVIEVDDKTADVINSWQHKRFHWPFGHMRGGTAPVFVKDLGWLAFIHSATDHAWLKRRYSMSAVVFAPEPPFAITRLSRLPILYGTQQEAFCGSGNGQCIFPSGVILNGEQWDVSAGVNDTFNVILHLGAKKVIDGMVPADYYLQDRRQCYLSRNPRTVPFIAGPEYKWLTLYAGGHGTVGILETDDPFARDALENDPEISAKTIKIPRDEYERLKPRPIQRVFKVERADVTKMNGTPGIKIVNNVGVRIEGYRKPNDNQRAPQIRGLAYR